MMSQERRLIPSAIIGRDENLLQAMGVELSPAGFRFGIKVKIYNAQMRSRRLVLGLSQKALAEKAGFGQKAAYLRVGQIEGFYRFPNDEEAERIALALDLDRETVFPHWLQFYILDKGRGTIHLERPVAPQILGRLGLSQGSISSLPPGSKLEVSDEEAIWETVVKNRLRERVKEVLESFTPEERKMIILRFGLEDGEERTYGQLAKEFGITAVEAHRILAGVLKKLRHPRSSRMLRDFLD